MKVVIIEDQRMFREFLAKLCRDLLKLTVVGEAGDGTTGLSLCCEKKPDLVLLDLMLPDVDGFQVAARLLQGPGAPRLLALSSEIDEFTLHRLFNSGIHGYVDKNGQSFQALNEGIRALAEGRCYFTEVVGKTRMAMRTDPQSFTKLFTEREFEVLPLLGEGLSNEKIAPKVRISPSTVQGHRKHIMGKLGLHHTPELIRYCLKKGITKVQAIRSPSAG